MTTRPRKPARRLAIAALTIWTAAHLTGCAFFTVPTPDASPAPAQSESPATGTQPSDIPDADGATSEEIDAMATAALMASSAREWVTAWDESGCTGERAAADERACQIMLMDLADGAEGVADVLEGHAEVLSALEGAADAARVTADAAAAWLDGWCGGYADPACAAPGEALVDAQRDFDVAMDAWLDRETPDA